MVAVAALVVFAVSCEPGVSVQIRNSTDKPVFVATGRERGAALEAPGLRVEPSETISASWIGTVPSKVQYRVQARSESGELVFCRIYSFEDPQIRELRIGIIEGDLACD